VFVDIEKRFKKKMTGYDHYDGREAYYYIGKFDFLTGKMDEALKNLWTSDSLSHIVDKDEASGFMSLANLMIGMIYDTQNKRAQAVEQYRKVLEMREFENSRRDAKQYLQKPYKRN
jgi:predicted negative regulator of RcsB-dependent stress response